MLESTAIEKALESESPPVSWKRIVSSAVPVVVGVPLITPVAALRASPAGKAPTVTVQVPVLLRPTVCSCAKYAEDTAPAGSDAVEITGAEAAAIASLRAPASR